MVQPDQFAPEENFAGVLASLATPKSRQPSVQPGPLGDGLRDDVLAISQSGALHAARHHLPEPPQRDPSLRGHTGRPLSIVEAGEPLAALPPDRKRASITIRVSAAECAQLRSRAAESGMTVSAYLRSCTLEVESLRAQVKDAMSRMRAAAEPRKPVASERPSLRARIAQIWPHPRDAHRSTAA